mmetsp:Transcript_26733/g.77148  ORF Transcript_26733/g.77148 Transcript_26733/m.77148 type:complete len:272 (-) Transcript_26733:33-848(-)
MWQHLRGKGQSRHPQRGHEHQAAHEGKVRAERSPPLEEDPKSKPQAVRGHPRALEVHLAGLLRQVADVQVVRPRGFARQAILGKAVHPSPKSFERPPKNEELLGVRHNIAHVHVRLKAPTGGPVHRLSGDEADCSGHGVGLLDVSPLSLIDHSLILAHCVPSHQVAEWQGATDHPIEQRNLALGRAVQPRTLVRVDNPAVAILLQQGGRAGGLAPSANRPHDAEALLDVHASVRRILGEGDGAAVAVSGEQARKPDERERQCHWAEYHGHA